MEGYWSKFTSRQVSRRRALQGATAVGAGAAALALIGCGGGGDGDSSGVAGDASGLLTDKKDTSSQAVAGGVWSSFRPEDLISTNPLSNTQGAASSELAWAYGLLTKHSFAAGRKVGPDEIVGDVAESWEVSSDGLTVTLKMRPGLKFHNIPPVSGRAVLSSDVKFSFDTAEKTSPYRANLFASASPAAPIESVTTPDDKTVVMKLKFPYGPIIEALAHNQHPYIVPKEADGGFNANAGMIGSGPFMLTQYQQSSRMEYTKNPDYYVKGRPFVDKVTKPIITDYAAALAQFETKAIYDMGTEIAPADILRLKRDHPELLMWTEPRPAGYISQKIYNFSKQPDSPVKDVRVRRAFSMTLERDLYIDAIENTSQFEKEGIPVETAWNGPLAAFFPSWIDPRDSKEFGEAAQYYQYNVEEAKKLITAAGLTKVKMPWGYYTDRGTDHVKINEIVVNMAVDSGLFEVSLEPLPYASTWRDICQYSNGGGFAGACYNSADGFNEDSYLVNLYTPEGKFATFPTAQPGYTDVILKARQEVDPKRRSELLKDFQRKVAPEFHYLPIPGRSLQYTLRWPWLQNHLVFEQGGTSARVFSEVWLDEKKKV